MLSNQTKYQLMRAHLIGSIWYILGLIQELWQDGLGQDK